MFNLILINFIVVYIINHSGIIADISKGLWNFSHKGNWTGQIIGKPFGCALCTTFWITMIYGFFITTFINALGIACLSALLTLLTDRLITMIIRIINKIH